MSAARSMVIDGVEIPERLIAEEAQNHPAASLAEARAAAGHALAIRALLLDRARRLGLDAAPDIDPEGREETPDEALVRAVLDLEVRAAPPTDEECLRFFEAQRERFTSPTLSEASHILFSPAGNTEQDWSDARLQAEVAIRMLKEQPGRFAELSASLSGCPSGAVGGSLGQLGPGDLAPEVETALQRLSPGETSAEPVKSRFGWHILRLDHRIAGRELPFEQARPRIRTHLESRAWTAAATRHVAELAAAAREKGVALTVDAEGRVASGGLSLGDLLSDSDGVSARLEPWLDGADPAFAARLRASALAAEQTFSAFVQSEVSAFVKTADDEAWTRVISATRDGEDPALACVRAILKTRPAAPGRTFTLIRRN